MPNPSPKQSEGFRQQQNRSDDLPAGQKLSKSGYYVRLSEQVDSLVRLLPNKSAWLRRVVTEAAMRELANNSEQE